MSEETSELSSKLEKKENKQKGSPFIKTLKLGVLKICQMAIKGLILTSQTAQTKILPKIEEAIKKGQTNE